MDRVISILASAIVDVVDFRRVSVQFSSVQFSLFAFINYSTKLHVIIIHLAGSPGSYFAYLKECFLKKTSKKLECKLSMAEQKD